MNTEAQDGYKRATYNTDPDEWKKLCLKCTRAECTNCLSKLSDPTKKNRSRYDKDAIEPLIKAGMSQLKIGNVLGVSKAMAHKWVSRYWTESELGL